MTVSYNAEHFNFGGNEQSPLRYCARCVICHSDESFRWHESCGAKSLKTDTHVPNECTSYVTGSSSVRDSVGDAGTQIHFWSVSHPSQPNSIVVASEDLTIDQTALLLGWNVEKFDFSHSFNSILVHRCVQSEFHFAYATETPDEIDQESFMHKRGTILTPLIGLRVALGKCTEWCSPSFR